MEQPGDALISGLLNAFYNATCPEAFLASAGDALKLRLFLNQPDLTASPSSAAVQNKVDVQNKLDVQNKIEVITDGKYIATLSLEGGNSTSPKKILEPIASLLIKGITLYNWFPFAFSARPDEYLRKCTSNFTGLFCLYVPVQMSKRANVEACMRLSSTFNAAHCFIEPDGFTQLFNVGCHGHIELLEALNKELTHYDYPAGLSGPFKNPALAQGCMEKAKEAALSHCNNDIGPIRHASKVRWRMFSKSAASSLLLGGFFIADFLQYSLKLILSYDAQNGTQYYESMYQYLLYGKNLKPAAQALLIHRNTLAYRIGRISELFDIDFEDRHICFELLFSCKLYEETVARP